MKETVPINRFMRLLKAKHNFSEMHESPLCTEGILKKENIIPWQKITQKIPLIHKDSQCRLHFYYKSDMVTCIEALTSNVITSSSRNTSMIHITFVGDSRIHQIFMNFLLSVNITTFVFEILHLMLYNIFTDGAVY